MAQKHCVVVGAGPGMGLAIARRFGREDFSITLMARREESLEALSNELSEEGVSASAVVVDVSSDDSVKRAFASLGTSPDVVVYNAAVSPAGAPTSISSETLANSLEINVIGALRVVREVAPSMRAQKNGTILLTGGGLALQPYFQMSALSVGKAALRSLAQSLFAELKGDGVHVATVTICGFVKPDTHFDPDKIAEHYFRLYQRPQEEWEAEFQYT